MLPAIGLGLRALLAGGEGILSRIAASRAAGAIANGGIKAAQLGGEALEAAAPMARAGMNKAAELGGAAMNAGREFAGGVAGSADAAGSGLPYAAGQAVKNGAEAVGSAGREFAGGVMGSADAAGAGMPYAAGQATRAAGQWVGDHPYKSVLGGMAAGQLIDAMHMTPQKALDHQSGRQNGDVKAFSKIGDPEAGIGAAGIVQDVNKHAFTTTDSYDAYNEFMRGVHPRFGGQNIPTHGTLSRREYNTLKGNPILAKQFAPQNDWGDL